MAVQVGTAGTVHESHRLDGPVRLDPDPVAEVREIAQREPLERLEVLHATGDISLARSSGMKVL